MSKETSITATRDVEARSPLEPGLERGAQIADTGQAWYALGILALAYALAYIDRQLLNLIVDPIKRSLLLSDTDFSFIQGTAFVSAYLIAIPFVGRLADVANRRNVLVAAIAIWSLCTALCGMAHSYSALFWARFGVGVSEACVFPIGCSLITDYFSQRRAPRAVSVFMASQWFGAGFSLVAGGWVIASAAGLRDIIPPLATLEPWQMAFIVVGLPGVAFSLLVLATVREPARRSLLRGAADERAFSIRETFRFLWQRRGFYLRVWGAVSMQGIVVLGMPAWLPAFLIRFHGVSPAVVGYRLGAIAVICGATGVLAGPWLSRLLERRGFRETDVRVVIIGMLGMGACCVAIPFAPGAFGAFCAIGGAIFSFGIPIGLLVVILQFPTPNRLRGITAAFHTAFSQLVGYGLGPTAIAMITDKVFGNPRMVGYSIAIVCGVASLVGVLILLTLLPRYRRMLAESAVK